MKEIGTHETVLPASEPVELDLLTRQMDHALAIAEWPLGRGVPLAKTNALLKEARTLKAAERLERAEYGALDELSWLDLYALHAKDPGAVLERWTDMKQVARQELRSGMSAAEAVTFSWGTNPFELAQFLVAREELMEQWQPRDGIERSLLSQMAQAQRMQEFWMSLLLRRATIYSSEELEDAEHAENWKGPRVTEHAAMDQAAQMIERFNKMFLRCLRALQETRRVPIIVQNAGQVNVGQQQVNVAAVATSHEVTS